TNHSAIMQCFNDACLFLWNGTIKYNRVWLVCTDQASYMLKAFKSLKDIYTELNHVTCLAHSLHRVCETVREEMTLANEFIAAMKKNICKSLSRIRLHRETCKDLPLPPTSVITRWGSWIKCAKFFCEHFSAILEFIEILPENSGPAGTLKCLINSSQLKDELITGATFHFLTEAIEKLEEQNVEKE